MPYATTKISMRTFKSEHRLCWSLRRQCNSCYMSQLMRLWYLSHRRPAKAQASLRIHPVWSESSLSAWRNLGSLASHWAHIEDSDQTGRMPRLIWVFAGHKLILLVLSCRGSYFEIQRLWLISVAEQAVPVLPGRILPDRSSHDVAQLSLFKIQISV